MWRTRNQNYQVPQEKRCDPKWTRCGHAWGFEEMRTVVVPLKRTKQETYFRKHWYVNFCCFYIRMTPPVSGLLPRWILESFLFVCLFVCFFNEKHVWFFIIIHVFLFIFTIISSVKNQHNLHFAVELKWPNYSGHQDIELIFAVDLCLRFTFLLPKSVCCWFLVSRERKLVLLKRNVILLD